MSGSGSTGAAMKEQQKVEVPEVDENEEELRSMFDEWAKRYNKVYETEEEKEDRFSIFLFEMRGRNNTDGLNESADRTLSELRHGTIVTWAEPDIQDLKLPDFGPVMREKMSRQELKEGRMEFEKWMEMHGKVYASEKERKKRLMIYLKNKFETEELLKAEPGKLWKQRFGLDDYTDEDMDKVWWEFPEQKPKYKPKCCCSSRCA